jgi:formyl-CoA transferase
MAMALEGIKIVEVAQAAAAPMGGRLLADLGADVIHIENPITGDNRHGALPAAGKARGIHNKAGRFS